ncbi:MAG: hypothetical protein BZY75_03880 [SAR202 cluster bacterium Io17-Chloro-G7]|nr:MAG: hypothetical protein BZY75_03880 [SAR202 cluster bacterium Io17-Chloro-G7]
MVKRKGMGMSLLLVAGTMVAGPVIAGCSSGSSASAAQWAATEGAIGRINMDAVKEAFEKSKTVEEFEKRLNEIYEGDRIVLIRAKEEGTVRTIEAFEDLNGDGEMDPSQDDLLFTITNENNSNNLQGHGANRHYSSFGGGGNFLFTYLIFSSLTRGGGYGYFTPRSRAGQMQTQRDNYRNSSAYAGGRSGGGGQVKRNSDYYNRQKAANGTAYNSAGRQLSTSRQSYIGTQRTSGAFRTSNTGVRSGFGKFGGASAGRGGGASGGGGAQVILRLDRW